MPEVNAGDVYEFTGGRLADDDETERMVRAALASARRYTGWHVSPVVEDAEIILDGPDSRILFLPTRKLVELTSINEDGDDLDLPTAVKWSAGGPPGILDRPVGVRKQGRGWWTAEYQGITVVMTHGYTEDEAVDWRQAIMSMVDRMAMVSAGVNESSLIRKTVDDVTYGYANPFSMVADETIGSVASILDDFCLPRLEFM